VFTPFSPKLKYSQAETDRTVYRLGAPEFVLGRENFARFEKLTETYTGRGERVLVFAEKSGDGFRPLLFLSLENGLRPNVRDTFSYLAEQEVKVIVISGDNPLTVSTIGKTVGIPRPRTTSTRRLCKATGR
jgi:cation-transporting ATPase E